MGWASFHIEKLMALETIKFRPRGNSMTGIVNNGQLVTVEPILVAPKVGDVVLCKVKGREYLHIIRASDGERFLIGNNRGKLNGWTARKNIFGLLINVED